MITELLKSEKYYFNKLPYYLRESETFFEHFKIWIEFLKGTDNYADDLLSLLDIFNPRYFIINAGKTYNFLTNLGELYGISRNFSVDYYDEQSHTQVTTDVSLSDEEFLLAIKAQIVKNSFHGSNEELNKFYTDAGLPILYLTTEGAHASCNIYLITDYLGVTTQNVIHMFKNRMLTIESVGIHYLYSIVPNGTTFGIWDNMKWYDEDTTLGARWAV